ncbi:MAG: ATP-binding protein [Chloroflexia bacterium]
MLEAPVAANEADRIAAVRALSILDSLPDGRFDRITRFTTRIFNVPIAIISLIDVNRQWFKSCLGLPNTEIPRSISFCTHTILSDDPFVIPDTLADPRFVDNPLVTDEPHVRFYAGQSLHDTTGYRIGTLSIFDRRPRQLSPEDVQTLRDLALSAEDELNALEQSRALDTESYKEERIRAVMDSIPDAILTFDESGALQSLNPAAELIFGCAAEDARGRPISTFIPALGGAESDSDGEQSKGPLLEQLLGQRPGGRGTSIDLQGRRRDGTLFPLDFAVSEAKRRAPGAPAPSLFIGVARDITEHKRAEELLRNALDEQRTLQADALKIALEIQRSETNAVFDATSEALMLVGRNSRLLRANSRFAEMFSMPLDEVLGHSFAELEDRIERVFKDAAALHTSVSGTASDPDRHFSTDLAQRWPEERELSLYSAPVHTAGKRFIGRLYVFRDVTKERAADRAKSEFVSMVSHELRTPLTSIKGYVDLILDGDAGEISEDQQDFLGIVKNNTDRLVDLINDLLDVSRIEQGRIDLNREPVDIGGSIQSVATSMKPLLEEKNQQLTLDVPPELPPVLADPARVTQILSNLLSNAYKYTPSGGHITIAAYAEPGRVCVSVQDTGIGLTKEEQGKLFTRFFRARNSTTQEVGGTGLGLTITKSLVKLHGGEMTVASAPGAGATFSFTLPLPPVPEEAAQEAEESHLSSGQRPEASGQSLPTTRATDHSAPDLAGAGKKLLVVDDEPDIANLIRRYLEKAGYHVEIARTANEAYRFARELHPDLITLDISLPDADGFSVLEWLKNDPSTAQIPVVVLSVVDDSARGMLLGAVDYLRKPIEEDALVERVGAILEC